MAKYDHKKIEKKWQKIWQKKRFSMWQAKDFGQKNFYVLDMFPYPSGDGLHVGHVEGYTASDIYSRYLRLKGKNVLHPMGWDAFGLPAENYAIANKINPIIATARNVKHFKKQLQSISFSYDWSREINTTDPNYYKWTQWIFLQLFKQGLAFEKESPVNWCPSCKTVLADEEAASGVCERCGSPTEIRNLKQWHLKITAYADRLLQDLELLDWPENVKKMQENWIGKSRGAQINFEVEGSDKRITVFTTRPDTLFGITFLLLAPEHPLAYEITNQAYYSMVDDYVIKAKQKAAQAGQLASVEIQEKIKTGVFTGGYVKHPLTKELIPVWISDYVLMTYGTGAVMGVPGHDQRDFEFAQKFNLPIKSVIINPNQPSGGPINPAGAYEGEGILVDSGNFSGLQSFEAKEKIIEHLAGQGFAQEKVVYKLHDWIFSRQRYWGEPIPVIKCPIDGDVPVPEKDLPVLLPRVKAYEPTGGLESPLAGIKSWVKVRCPKCGQWAKRETNTMPQWAGSCWYYLRFIDPKNKKAFTSFEKLKKWLPVDLYLGGVEHAVLHLLYARFWHKFLYDLGAVPTKEPFLKLINQGVILGPDNEKMSKSRGNVVNPDDIIKEYGADTLRLYEMFMGPLADSKPWEPKSIIGIYRFLNRVWDLLQHFKKVSKKLKDAKASQEIKIIQHKAVKKVEDDILDFKFNTAISALMEFQKALTLELEQSRALEKEQIKVLLLLLFPFAPHLSQELLSRIGVRGLADQMKFPGYSFKYLRKETFSLVIQINGKTKQVVQAEVGISQAKAKELALAVERIKKAIGRKQIKKEIFIKDRLLNLVV